MAMMCVTPPVAASKERQTSAKSCKAGKVHSAHTITLLSLHEYRLSGAFFLEHAANGTTFTLSLFVSVCDRALRERSQLVPLADSKGVLTAESSSVDLPQAAAKAAT
jgi:hypothetical protein